MHMLITEDFLKDIPTIKKDFIIKKLGSFSKAIKNSKYMFDVPSGFWIRKVKGTNIFKFRVNNGDRILFSFIKERGEEDIVFLRYCNHDEQIRKAYEIDQNVLKVNTVDFEPQLEEYIEDEADENFTSIHVKSYMRHDLVDLSKLLTIVLEDEYIGLLVDENNEDFIYYLSEDQYKCIEIVEKPIMLSGCAGSGKSMVAIRKLLLCNENEEGLGYFSCNRLLVEKSKEYFNKFKKEEQYADFYSINDFCLQYLDVRHEKLVVFNDFKIWVKHNKNIAALMKGYSVEQVWSEIFGIIKGYRGTQWDRRTQKKLMLEEYLDTKHSMIEITNRYQIYKISEQYQKWLDQEGLFDENDIALNCIKKQLNEHKYKFDYLVIDEIQDMSETQILLCYLMVKHPQNIMLVGDMNQIIRPNFFNLNRIKNLFYVLIDAKIEETCLYKNYRNVSGIVNMLNELAMMRKRYISNSKYDQNEIYIREGNKPIITRYTDENIRVLMNRVDNTDYCVVVVGDEQSREQLKELGCPSGRIFTVEEIKGLEYQNVICFNMIANVSGEWETIFSGNAFGNDYYRLFFNKLYVACTRTKSTLCLLENENAKVLVDQLKNYCTCLDEFFLEVMDFAKVSTINDWLEEAKKLEIAERYHQAIHAYEKAGYCEGANRCRLILNMREKKSYNYQKSYALRIDSEMKQPLNGNIIKRALDRICSRYRVSLDNYAEILISYNREDSDTKSIDYFEEDIDQINRKIAMLIDNTYKNEKGINKRKVTIHVCLKINDGIHIDEYYQTDHFDTIIASYKNYEINIITRTTQSEEQKKWIKSYSSMKAKEYLKEVGLNMDLALSNEDFNKGINELITYSKENNLEQGIILTEALISKGRMPVELSAKLYGAISQFCIGDERYTEALEYAQKAIILNHEDFDAYNSAGIALLNLGKPETARGHFEKALSLNMNFIIARNNLELAKKNLEEEIIKGYARKTLINHEYDKINEELTVLYNSGKYDEVILQLYDLIDRYFMDDNRESELYTKISLCYIKLGDMENARKYINFALEKNPDNIDARKLSKLSSHQDRLP